MTHLLDRFISTLRSGEQPPIEWADELPLSDLNARGPADHTPLGSATFHGTVELAARLLEHGADPNRVYANGRTPLFGARGPEALEMVRLLLERGADPDLGIPAIGHTPLQRAAKDGSLPRMELLIAHGADINARTLAPNPDFHVEGEAGGETPLHYAAAFADAEVIQYLIDHGADPAARNNAGQRPCDWAEAHNRSVEIAQLVRAGAS